MWFVIYQIIIIPVVMLLLYKAFEVRILDKIEREYEMTKKTIIYPCVRCGSNKNLKQSFRVDCALDQSKPITIYSCYNCGYSAPQSVWNKRPSFLKRAFPRLFAKSYTDYADYDVDRENKNGQQ